MMSPDSTPYNVVLDACQHQHRRIVLRMLAEEQRSLTLRDLTKAVLKYNHQTELAEASEDKLTKIRISLCHNHLPKLGEAGLLKYNAERELVEPTEQLEQMQPTLSIILDADPSLEASMAL